MIPNFLDPILLVNLAMKTKLKSIFIFGMIFFLPFFPIHFSMVYNVKINERTEYNTRENIKSASYWDLTGDSIFINGSGTGVGAHNWSWVEDQIWFGGGNGNWNNPYVIENITIDGQSSGSCIKVVDSNIYFTIRNCTLFNSGNIYPDGGITLMNVNNSVIFNNTCSFNNYYGIVLDQCFNSTIHENIANNNTIGGIGVAYSYDIKILKNKAHYNDHHGLQLYSSHDFLIEKNIFNYNKNDGINSLWVNSSNVFNNTLRYNTESGISWNAAYYNNVSRNLISDNEHSGFSSYNFRTGFILENDIYENGGIGLYLTSPDAQKINENSTLEGNRIIGNEVGLTISSYNNNTIRNNIVTYNKEHGMIIAGQFNRISNNTVSYNYESGISISRRNNVISKNTILFNHQNGIYSWHSSHLNNISNNTIKYNNEFGIKLVKSTNNTINFNEISYNYGGVFIENSNYNDISQNNINYNYREGIYLSHSNHSIIVQNKLFGNEVCILEFECEQNFLEDNECSITSTDIFVEILTQSLSSESFNIIFRIYNSLGQGIDFTTILMWWNGMDVSADVQSHGNGFYFISVDPITVAPGDDPIMLNMTISATGYQEKYYETYLAVDPEVIDKEEPGKLPPAIPGYSILLLMSLITMISIIFLKKKKI